MNIENQIALRPRFKLEIQKNEQEVKQAFNKDFSKSNCVVKIVDNHIFIRFKKEEQHFWSPQLHLEIEAKNQNQCFLKGLFGPPPTVWTMFMFFHFIVAGLFLIFAIWAYSNYSLKQDYQVQVFGLVSMIILWFVLYIAGTIGKTKGKPQINLLCEFLKDSLELKNAKVL